MLMRARAIVSHTARLCHAERTVTPLRGTCRLVTFSTVASDQKTLNQPTRPVSERYLELVKNGKLKRDEKQVALASKLDRLSYLIHKYHLDRIDHRIKAAEVERLKKEALEREKQQKEATAKNGNNTENAGSKLEAQASAKEEKASEIPELPPLKIPRGIYVHGNVGTGKTMLMDVFLQNLSDLPTRRVHLHNFLQEIHAEVHKRRKEYKKGAYEIIGEIGQELARENVVLAFDEFYVTDIADSAILEGLLDAMVREGIVLVATSNVDPKDLHETFTNLFLPKLLAHCRIHDIESELDYREDGISPDGERPNHVVVDDYESVMGELLKAHKQSLIQDFPVECGFNRSISIPHVWYEQGGALVACVTFDWLCGSKLNNFGPNEYHAICNRFDKVIIGGVPKIEIKPGRVGDQSRRFGTFMDIAYDALITVVTISEHGDPFSIDDPDEQILADVEDNPQTEASLRSFLRARSRWRHLSRGRN